MLRLFCLKHTVKFIYTKVPLFFFIIFLLSDHNSLFAAIGDKDWLKEHLQEGGKPKGDDSKNIDRPQNDSDTTQPDEETNHQESKREDETKHQADEKKHDQPNRVNDELKRIDELWRHNNEKKHDEPKRKDESTHHSHEKEHVEHKCEDETKHPIDEKKHAELKRINDELKRIDESKRRNHEKKDDEPKHKDKSKHHKNEKKHRERKCKDESKHHHPKRKEKPKHNGQCPTRHCPQKERPNKPRKLHGTPGQSCLGGLSEFASFGLSVKAGSSFMLYPFPNPIPFGPKIAGSGDAILSQHATGTTFNLLPGDYKISAGVSTFGVAGMQLILSINDKQVFRWPNTPTVVDDSTFIEFTVIEHISSPSMLYVSTSVEIPGTPINEYDTLLNYLTIEKLD